MMNSHFLRRRRRGQAAAIGAVLFMAITSLVDGFLFEVFQTQLNMNEFDITRSQARTSQ